MIDSITGKVVKLFPGRLIVRIGAFNLNIAVPLTLSSSVTQSSVVRLFTHILIKDDKINIIGFGSEKERDIFLAIQKTPKVGPKTALAILSALSAEQLIDAVESSDVSMLSAIPKIGKKTAERILFELKGLKTGESGEVAGSDLFSDAVGALVSLGCDKNRSEKAVSKILKEKKDADLETLIKSALSVL